MSKAISNKNKVELAHQRRNDFLEVHHKSKLVELQLIAKMYEGKDWEKLGFDDPKSYFTSPVESGGLSISYQWANQLYLVWQRFNKELSAEQIVAIGPRKLYEVKDLEGDWISKAKMMSLEDLRLEKLNIDENTCEHIDEHFVKCKRCKRWQKLE